MGRNLLANGRGRWLALGASVVLACGLAVTVLSDLPSLRTFGWLSAFAMIAALVADLLILRPTAMFLFRLARRGRRQEVAEQAAE